MEMKQISSLEVHAQKVAELGLDPSALDLTSVEAISCALRRAASFACPCSNSTLVRGVSRPLRGLVRDFENFKVIVEETLDALISHGDLMESRQLEDGGKRSASVILYALPPSFVVRRSGAVILLGIASDQISALPPELEKRIEYVNYVRRLNPIAGEDLSVLLREFGLIQLSTEAWLKTPVAEKPGRYVARFDQMLDATTPSREVPGLWIIDPHRSVGYYRGRWVQPGSHSGRFVARRNQAFGADLWCYVELKEGRPERLIDLPTKLGLMRGCDEAWRLQMALDAYYRHPQKFRIKNGPNHSKILELFSPVPMWAIRRWNAAGEPIASTGCLFAYRFRKEEIEEEARFALNMLWLDEIVGL